jgi:hypothetical protein
MTSLFLLLLLLGQAMRASVRRHFADTGLLAVLMTHLWGPIS